MGITQLLSFASILFLFPQRKRPHKKKRKYFFFYPETAILFFVLSFAGYVGKIPVSKLQTATNFRVFDPRTKVYFRWKFVNVGPITLTVNFSKPIKWTCLRTSIAHIRHEINWWPYLRAVFTRYENEYLPSKLRTFSVDIPAAWRGLFTKYATRSRWVGACNFTISLSRRFHGPIYF